MRQAHSTQRPAPTRPVLAAWARQRKKPRLYNSRFSTDQQPLHESTLPMPIYAYRCDACGHAKDVLQKMSDPVLTTCPACGAEAFQKQVTAAGFQLKGSGWYVTDFRGGASGAPSDKAADGNAKPAATAETGKSSDAASPTPAAAPSAGTTAPAAATPSASSSATAPASPPKAA
jgi:putative FmdB family regulatory protein